MSLRNILGPKVAFIEVGGGPDRLVQKLFVVGADNWQYDFEFAHMAAAEYEHGMPQHEFEKFVKAQPVLTATEVWANGYCADVFLWHPKKFELAKYRQDLKLMATGLLARHRDPGLSSAIAAKASNQPLRRHYGHAWFDITGGVLIAVDAEKVPEIAYTLRKKAQET